MRRRPGARRGLAAAVLFAFALVGAMVMPTGALAEETTVSSFSSLQEAVSAEGESVITIDQDVAFESTITVGEGKNVTIRGASDEVTLAWQEGVEGNTFFAVDEGGSLTLDINIDAKNDTTGYKDDLGIDVFSKGSTGVIADVSGALTLLGGTYQNVVTSAANSGAFYVDGENASMTINGGVITNNKHTNQVVGSILAKGGSSLVMTGGSITGNDSMIDTGQSDNAAVYILGDGADTSFTMTGGEITKNAGYYGGVVVMARDNGAPSFVMNYGLISENEGKIPTDYHGVEQSRISGGVCVMYRGSQNDPGGSPSFTMTGGEISSNIGGFGAGVRVGQTQPDYANTAKFTMSGGVIKNNEAEYIKTGNSDSGGGGVGVLGAAEFYFSAGEISGNVAPIGGGVAAYDLYKQFAEGAMDVDVWNNNWNVPGRFEMTGGTITGNTALIDVEKGDNGCGGGVYVASNTCSIFAGTISNNTAERQGGGVYVGSTPYVLHMKDVLVTDNTASILGGGMWLCPTGDAHTSVSNGALISGNSATSADGATAGDDIASVPQEGRSATITLADRALGGGAANWYDDGAVIGDTVLGSADPNAPRYDGQGATEAHPNISNEAGQLALKSAASDGAVELATELAKVVITGNSSQRGGGIGTNGAIVIGPNRIPDEDEKTWSLTVNKEWSENTPESAKGPVILDLKVGDMVIDTVTLSEENNWIYTFEDLADPSTLIASDGTELSYSVSERNAGKPFDATYSDIVVNEANREMSITVTNTPSEPVLVTPADITIYMGGTNGYESVIDDGVDDGTKTNSLPEPGFYLTLPESINDALEQSEGIGESGVADLSKEDYAITFREAGGTKTWKLEMYGDSHSVANPDENGSKHFIYRIVPAVEGQDPIRLEFKDLKTGERYVSDAFDPNVVGTLNNKYEMGIYPGEVNQQNILMDITVGGETYTMTVKVETGALNVRYVTGDQEDVVTDVLDDIENAKAPGKRAYAVMKEQDTKFFINGSDIDVTDEALPSLLFDDVVSDHNTDDAGTYDEMLGSEAIGVLANEGIPNPKYQAKYLDLVDANNGNVWLTADKSLTVYWPRPDGTDESTKFYLVHFVGLDREMSSDSEDVEQAIQDAVENGDARVIEGVTNDSENGVTFTLDPEVFTVGEGQTAVNVNRVRFSPFVLVWGTTGGSTPTPDPDPSNPSAPDVDKKLTGRDLKAGEFSFEITATGSNSSSVSPKSLTGHNDANGNVTFTNAEGKGGFIFKKAGTYTFKVSEVLPADDDPQTPGTQLNGVTYDSTTHTVVARVTKSGGKLVATWQGEDVTFINEYEPSESAEVTFGAKKVLNGRVLVAGEFAFELVDSEGKVVGTATNDAAGNIIFSEPVEFLEAGTFTYTIREVAGSVEGVTYDGTVHTAVVTVTDNGNGTLAATVSYDGSASLPVFTNTYSDTDTPDTPDTPDEPDQPTGPGKPSEPSQPSKPSEPARPNVPDTGDHTNAALPVLLALGGAALVGGALWVKVRKDH